MSEELIFLIGVILMNILFWTFIHIFEIKQTKLENKMELEKQVEQLENIRKEAIEELSYMSTDAYVEDYDIREKHYNLLMNILSKGEISKYE